MKGRYTMTAIAALLAAGLIGCSSEQAADTASHSAGNETASGQSANREAEQSAPAAKEIANSASDSIARQLPPPRSYPAPPNGEPYDSMYFDHAGTNPFIATEDDALSTFAVDVDTGSYSIVRSYISNGALPPDEAVRVEEFVNYFNPDYKAPADQAFAIHVDGGPSPFGEGYELLRVGLKGKEVSAAERLPANLTFVIDVSGSMNREDRLGLVKRSLHLLVDNLAPSDQIAIITYGTDASVVLEPTSLEEKNLVKDAIDSLAPSGSTNAEEGLRLAYEMAERQLGSGAINRVILCSDGVANVGETSAEGILKTIQEYASKKITLTTVGFGMGNYNDTLMEQLANQGDGVYAYVDSFTEARRLFVENLSGTLQTIARDVKIQVEFDPATVDRYRLIGYENRDVRDEDFRNDETDAGEVGAGHTVTALYEVKLAGENARANLGTVRIRYVDETSKRVEEWAVPLRSQGSLSDELRFLAAVAEYAELLRGSYWAKDGSMANVLTLAEQTATGEREQQFVTMVKDTIALQR